jgi:hypothetical protein
MPKEPKKTDCPIHGEDMEINDRSGQCEPCQYDKPITREESWLAQILWKWLVPERKDKR